MIRWGGGSSGGSNGGGGTLQEQEQEQKETTAPCYAHPGHATAAMTLVEAVRRNCGGGLNFTHALSPVAAGPRNRGRSVKVI